MIDKIFAPLALVMLVVFMCVIMYFVPRVELIIITIACVGLAGYDFWRAFLPGGDAHQGNPDIDPPKTD